jgi:hypothetical protein
MGGSYEFATAGEACLLFPMLVVRGWEKDGKSAMLCSTKQ